jgi:glyoxylase-like metal-dependent hydrolase (beta-lactamase superfamily II)
MHSISRRGFVISAAAASAAFGLDGPLEFLTPAFAQKAEGDKNVVKFKVGDIEVTQLYDGVWEKPHDPGFVKNASIDEVKAALKAGGFTDAHVPIPFTVTAIKSKGKVVLFDSGTGAQLAPTAGLITKNDLWKAAGLDPASVRTIVVTHFHPDHISGLMAKDTNAAIFPNAEIIVPAKEYAFWTDSATTAGAAKRIQAVFPGWKNIRQFEGEKEVVPGVRAVSTNGHTPGHTSYLLSSRNKQLIVLGDVTNMPALFVKNPGWHAAFDSDGAAAEAVRRKIFDRAIAEEATITGYHYGMPGAGTIKRDGKSYAFVPIKA